MPSGIMVPTLPVTPEATMYRATLVLVTLALMPTAARADKLVLVAGGGTKDGNCPATEAKVITPFGVDFDKADFTGLYSVALDAKGDNLFVADLENRRVRKISTSSGIVTTVAGNGQKGIPQDGADAAKAPLVDPRAVTVDKLGNVWILERSGH